MGEVVVHGEALGDGLVFGELLAVVGRDGVQQPLEGYEHFGGLFCEGLAVLALEQCYPRDARRPVVGREQRPPVVRPHNEVYLEVAETGLVIHHLGPLVDAHAVADDAPRVLLRAPLAVFAALAPQVGVQVAATALVAPHILVYGLHADAFKPLQPATPHNLSGL